MLPRRVKGGLLEVDKWISCYNLDLWGGRGGHTRRQTGWESDSRTEWDKGRETERWRPDRTKLLALHFRLVAPRRANLSPKCKGGDLVGPGGRLWPSVSLLYVMIWWVVTTACGALMSCSEARAGKGSQQERRGMWGWQCCDGLGSSKASKFQSKQKKQPEHPEPLPERASGPRPRHMEWHYAKTATLKHLGMRQRRVAYVCTCVCAIWAKCNV